jgi:hypothetical protein
VVCMLGEVLFCFSAWRVRGSVLVCESVDRRCDVLAAIRGFEMRRCWLFERDRDFSNGGTEGGDLGVKGETEEYCVLVVRGKREKVGVRGGAMVLVLVLVSGLLLEGLETRGTGLWERRGGDGVNVLPPGENREGERTLSGDKHSGESACELAV